MKTCIVLYFGLILHHVYGGGYSGGKRKLKNVFLKLLDYLLLNLFSEFTPATATLFERPPIFGKEFIFSMEIKVTSINSDDQASI